MLDEELLWVLLFQTCRAMEAWDAATRVYTNVNIDISTEEFNLLIKNSAPFLMPRLEDAIARA